MEKRFKDIPEIDQNIRKDIIKIPEEVREASGIKIFGKRLKSFIFTTDVSLICNTNADAVFAVYPFTPQPIITGAILISASVPVFCGVGGGITMGKRVINLALDAEFKGAMGVVLNSPTSNEVVRGVRNMIDIPIIVTVISEKENIRDRLEAGATILNVSAGHNTAKLVEKIRSEFPSIPIMATGGRNKESIKATIVSGANAIIFSPPNTKDILMNTCRI